MADYTSIIAEELKLPHSGVVAVASLLGEGCTVPFIARYRKEATGSLDEVAITSIRDGLARREELEKRRSAILSSLEERGLLDDALKEAVVGASTMTTLEDIYLPFRPKRRTRAIVAKEAGLEPLAGLLLAQEGRELLEAASSFVNEEKGVSTPEEALAGARDIIAEMISEDRRVRQEMRMLFVRFGKMSSKLIAKKKDDPESEVYKDYFEWEEPMRMVPSHRFLAVTRGEREGFLSVDIRPQEVMALNAIRQRYVKNPESAEGAEVEKALVDGYHRLLAPSMETEARALLKKRSDTEAILIFARNLRKLLMAPPFGNKAVIAVDPGIRTGCKVVALDEKGDLLDHTVIYPHQSKSRVEEAKVVMREYVKRFEPVAIAVGNGTAGRETVDFLRGCGLPAEVAIISVNESGASVYSASDEARKEFPDYDVTVRGAVSIGRRLMDPLAELVKIDPKSIGVGQYQHDVDQKQLKGALDDTVVSCVNAVGVDLNTASAKLLSYVSGLSASLADNVVKYREVNGTFRSRKEITKVPRLGPKAFEQSAGFLRIRDGENPLDASAVHPENYALVQKMAKDAGYDVETLMSDPEARGKIDLAVYVTDKVGMPTLTDIMAELEKPGRDPRPALQVFEFDPNVREIGDLQLGMVLNGIVTNVVAFGAFVDIGVHQDGLVHITRMGQKKKIASPSDVLSPGQFVKVEVIEVDLNRKRIGLALKSAKIDGIPQ